MLLEIVVILVGDLEAGSADLQVLQADFFQEVRGFVSFRELDGVADECALLGFPLLFLGGKVSLDLGEVFG